MDNEWRGQCFLSLDSSMSAGVTILLSADIQKQATNTAEIMPAKAHMVDISSNSPSLNNIYAPHIGTYRIQFKYGHVRHSQERIIILAGDFYCTLNYSTDRNHSEPYPCSAFRNVVQNHSLLDVWREILPVDRPGLNLFLRRFSQQPLTGFTLRVHPVLLSGHHYISITVRTIPSTFCQHHCYF